jgi:hypothetical protein
MAGESRTVITGNQHRPNMKRLEGPSIGRISMEETLYGNPRIEG